MTPARLAMLAGMLAVFPSWPQGVEYPAMKYRSNYLSSYYLSHGSNPSPWWPAWSPDGKWIAVSMYGSIWRVDPRTGAAEELTYNRKIHSQPAWSPDGTRIVFMSNAVGNWDLYVVNADGGSPERLTDALTDEGLPVYAPDGSKIAFVRNTDDVWSMWAMDPDGENETKLFDLEGNVAGAVPGNSPAQPGQIWTEQRIAWR